VMRENAELFQVIVSQLGFNSLDQRVRLLNSFEAIVDVEAWGDSDTLVALAILLGRKINVIGIHYFYFFIHYLIGYVFVFCTVIYFIYSFIYLFMYLFYLFIYLFNYLIYLFLTGFSRSGKKQGAEELSFSVIPSDIEELKIMWGITEGSLDLTTQPLSLNDPCFVHLGGIHFCGIESVD
jgi:hypothetical protein